MKRVLIIITTIVITLTTISCNKVEKIKGYTVYNVTSWSSYIPNQEKIVSLSTYKKKEKKGEIIKYNIGENVITLEYFQTTKYEVNLQDLDYYNATHINDNEIKTTSDFDKFQLRFLANGKPCAILDPEQKILNLTTAMSAPKETIADVVKQYYNQNLKAVFGVELDETYDKVEMWKSGYHDIYNVILSNSDLSEQGFADFIGFRFVDYGILRGVWVVKMDPELKEYDKYPSDKDVLPDIKAHIKTYLPEESRLNGCEIKSKYFIVYNDKICGLYTVTADISGAAGYYGSEQTILVELDTLD